MLILSWSTESTSRSSEGGDQAGMDFSQLVIEGLITQGRSFGSDMSEHPVERSQNTSDHIHPKLQVYTAECFVSNNPANSLVEEDEHIQTVESQIDDLVLNRVPVDIEDDRRVYEQYVILDYTTSRDESTGDGTSINLTFQELRIADIELVEAPSPSVERARPRTDTGTQTGDSTEGGTSGGTNGINRSELMKLNRLVNDNGGLPGVLNGMFGS